jgi:DinB family protein
MTDDDLNAIRAILTTTVPRWRHVVEAVPRGELERPAAEGEWSALECLRHLAGGERQFATRVGDYQAGRAEVTASAPDPDEVAGLGPDELLALWAERREANLTSLAGVSGAATAHSVRDPKRGDLTLGELLNGWAAHDLQHTVQAEEALMQAFIPRAGYFRGVFKDHDLAAGKS